MTGEVHTLLGWIEAIGTQRKDSPWLAIQKAWALTLAGRLEQVDQALQEAERLVISVRAEPPISRPCPERSPPIAPF